MNLFKPWLDLPEFQHVPESDRARLWAEIPWMHTGQSRLIAAGTVVVFVIAVVIRNMMPPEERWLDWTLVGAFVLILVGVAIFQQRRNARLYMRHLLREAYTGRRLPVCFRCGYLLGACPSDTVRCPECGNEEIRGNPAGAPDPNDIKF